MKRLKYISRFSKRMSSGEINAIARDAAISNRANKITGVLMATGGLFFQIIEGPAEQVDTLWRRILKDKRHKDVLLLSDEENVKERLFSKWSMGRIDLDTGSDIRTEPMKAILRTIFQQHSIMQDLMRSLEKSIWHFLVDPDEEC